MFDPTNWTGFHTWLSLIAIASGVVVVFELIKGRDLPWVTALFLGTAAATSLTGFGFAFNTLLPSHIVGAVALVVLALTFPARYLFGYAGPWRAIYVVGVVISLYLLVFVGVAQAFNKVPVLQASAPTQSEPPFAIAQLVVLAIFVAIGWAAIRGGRLALRPAI